MEKEKIVITYKNSDLDCLASAYAYSEYLNKTGYQASYYVSGQVQKEVCIVCELLIFHWMIQKKGF
jgi:nanoRNase/pAp phosphatase (c-di-AMP/oligoRNAs hydrolase)